MNYEATILGLLSQAYCSIHGSRILYLGCTVTPLLLYPLCLLHFTAGLLGSPVKFFTHNPGQGFTFCQSKLGPC